MQKVSKKNIQKVALVGGIGLAGWLGWKYMNGTLFASQAKVSIVTGDIT